MKRGGATDDLELLDLCQRADQFLRKPVGKILVVRITGFVGERKDGDRLAERSIGLISVRYELVGEQCHDSHGQHTDNQTIERATGFAGYRLRAVDLLFQLEAF